MLGEKIKSVADTHIVVLPEMFSSGFSMNTEQVAEKMDGESVNWMKRICIEKRIILTGSLSINDSGKYYNRMIWMMPDGSFWYYDKRHLFGYSGEDKVYERGKRRVITSVNGWKILLQVCYDLRFPAWTRQQIREQSPDSENNQLHEYDAIIYVANWPESRSHAWKTLLCARAIENQCYVIGVNRTGTDGNNIKYNGDSMVIHPSGQVLQHINGSEETVTSILSKDELDEFRNKFPFLKDADSFTLRL
jgi:predicted amidohydrolase